jgi:hypothetical protein
VWRGVLASKPLRQPPSIRPTSPSCSLRAMYLGLSTFEVDDFGIQTGVTGEKAVFDSD